jgi:hypothetical protein
VDYALSGRITNPQGEPLESLTVRAYDQDPNTPENLLGKEAVTDAEGRYKITFTEKDFKVGGVESSGPDVFIRVYDGDELLGESLVKCNSKERITIDLQVDYVKAESNEPARRVYGVVRDAQGHLLRGVTVKTFDRDLCSEQALAGQRAFQHGARGETGWLPLGRAGHRYHRERPEPQGIFGPAVAREQNAKHQRTPPVKESARKE